MNLAGTADKKDFKFPLNNFDHQTLKIQQQKID